MKKTFSVILLTVCILALTSCSSDKNKIKTTITSFFTALNHKDPQSAKLYATKESADFIGLMQQQLLQSDDKTQNSNEKFLISDININGDIATAQVRSETQQNPLTVTVKKESGDWKVAFDKNSIATMMNIEPNNPNKAAQQSQPEQNTQQSNTTPTAPGQTLNLSDSSVTPEK